LAYIPYVPESDITERDRVSDRDNIIRIHGVHSRVMRQHYDLYIEIMRRPSPLSRKQREMVAVTVSAANQCHY
jgi:alkylhydroperoxidase/carboxymuconolactone decarboxylase family protein YurZ